MEYWLLKSVSGQPLSGLIKRVATTAAVLLPLLTAVPAGADIRVPKISQEELSLPAKRLADRVAAIRMSLETWGKTWKARAELEKIQADLDKQRSQLSRDESDLIWMLIQWLNHQLNSKRVQVAEAQSD